MKELWVEKYRPKSLDEVVGQEEIVERLKAYAKTGNLPHLLFAGPAGTGKTTSAIALARDMFGENWRQNYYELNSSDERGIETVRTKVKEIARIAPFGGSNFKIIFLDEADNLTADAQAALRRTMETYSKTSRFILSANYSSRLIEPIQSRTAVFRFRPLKPDAIAEYIGRIAKSEKLKITDDGMEALAYVAEGDMRRAVNALQVAASLGSTVDAEVLYKVSSTVVRRGHRPAAPPDGVRPEHSRRVEGPPARPDWGDGLPPHGGEQRADPDRVAPRPFRADRPGTQQEVITARTGRPTTGMPPDPSETPRSSGRARGQLGLPSSRRTR